MFVPSAIKRKKAGTGGSSRINAAPALGPETMSKDAVPAKPDLLNTLREKLGPIPTAKDDATTVSMMGSNKTIVRNKTKDDYGKFLEEMGDLLAPPS